MKSHILIPKQTKLSEKERDALLESLKLPLSAIPKILKTDPSIQELNPEYGDIIRIERESATAGKTIFYRRVGNA